MLCILFRLIFVEKCDNLTHHRMNGLTLVADRLSYGDDFDAVFGELAKVKLLLKRLTEKAAIAVHHNEIEGTFAVTSAFNHLLKRDPAIIAGRRTRFNKFCDDFISPSAAPGPQLTALIGNRKIML